MILDSVKDRFDRLLVTDFDGTITAVDFYERVVAHLRGQEIPNYWEQYTRGELTHFQALQAIFAELRVDEARLIEIAEEVNLEESLPKDVQRLRDAGWGMVVVSAGSSWYIDQLFGRRDINVPIISNPGSVSGSNGLQMRLDRDSHFFCEEVGIDKAGVVRWALTNFERVAFAGDGRPDAVAAACVAPDLRFARGWLADHLQSTGVEFHPFERWSQVVDQLVDGSSKSVPRLEQD